MILRVCCNTCHSRFDVTVGAGEGHLVAQLADQDGRGRCPRNCGGRVNLTKDRGVDAACGLKDPVRLTVQEFYRAVQGMGLPDEVPNSPELIESLLKSNAVADVTLEQVNQRIYLHEIRLANGVTLHLAAGGRGAQVLKVTRAP